MPWCFALGSLIPQLERFTVLRVLGACVTFKARSQADREKESRAQVIVTRYEAGAAFHPRSAAWLEGFAKTSLVQSPTGEHDGQVDVTSGAGIVLALAGASSQAEGVRIR